MKALEDEPQLTLEACQGSVVAFEALVMYYEPRIRRMLYSLTQDSQLTQDLCQETFLAAYCALPRMDGEGLHFAPWLYRIALNQLRTEWRRRKHVAWIPFTPPQGYGDDVFEEPGEEYLVSDGTHPLEVLSGDITPVGFAADSSLEALRISSGKFQVIKYAASRQQFQLVLDDVAPGASSLCSPGAITIICDSNIAFAPNGHGLIVNAFYADGSQRVWFDDLTSKTHSLILKLDASMKVQLPGWDRIPVKSAG